MTQVVQVDQEVESKTETITKSIIEDTIMFDLNDKQAEAQKEPDLAQTMQVEDMGEGDIL